MPNFLILNFIYAYIKSPLVRLINLVAIVLLSLLMYLLFKSFDKNSISFPPTSAAMYKLTEYSSIVFYSILYTIVITNVHLYQYIDKSAYLANANRYIPISFNCLLLHRIIYLFFIVFLYCIFYLLAYCLFFYLFMKVHTGYIYDQYLNTVIQYSLRVVLPSFGYLAFISIFSFYVKDVLIGIFQVLVCYVLAFNTFFDLLPSSYAFNSLHIFHTNLCFESSIFKGQKQFWDFYSITIFVLCLIFVFRRSFEK